MLKDLNPTVDEFLQLNSELVSNCFSKFSLNLTIRTKRSRMRSAVFIVRKGVFEFYCAIFLLFNEPAVLLAQLAMRREGGLSGSYQFHRLYEIRRILKTEQISSAIEFGSGASSLLFNKYVERFVSIEESES